MNTQAATPLLAPGPNWKHDPEVFAALREDALNTHFELFRRYGDIVRLDAGAVVAHLLFHPDHARHVLQEAHSKYDKRTYGGRRGQAILGDGLLHAEGSVWQRQRRVSQPAFRPSEHGRVADIARDTTLETLERWAVATTTGETLQLDEELLHNNFLIICQLLLNERLEPGESKQVQHAFSVMANDGLSRGPNFESSLELVDSVMLRLVSERRRQPATDTLTRLIQASADQNLELGDIELRDQIKTLLHAGHETTTQTLLFALAHVAKLPDVMRRIREEAGAFDAADAAISAVDRLSFTESVVKETLRLHPALWCLERRVRETDSVGGYVFPVNSSVVVGVRVIQQHPDFWDEPAEFRPERFLDPRVPRHRHAFIPFGIGPRVCIGNGFAVVQLKLTLALILRRYRVELAPEFSDHMTGGFVLRLTGGLPVRLAPW